ncbi:hypothetical protein MPSEU_000500400 [Mayamaea pseudoterrestris]|nr:hypothetical protein MPSEU_000500400 [Mayamaea pseudoterrestris]
MRIILAILAARAAYPVVAHSSNDPSSSFDNSFAYSQSFSLDLSDEWDDVQRHDDGSPSDAAPADELCISSCLLYDEGSLFSSLAIIGGDIPETTAISPLAGEDESDNDDDDDNDGSSSMLGNNSLRRPMAAVAAGTGNDHQGLPQELDDAPLQSTMHQSTGSVATMLQIRGGAATIKRRLPPVPDAAVAKPTHANVHSHTGSQVLKGLFTTALVTLIFEAMIGHILEFLKIRMQTASGVIQAVSKGAIFGVAYSLALGLVAPWIKGNVLPKQLAYTLAGGFAGGMQGYVLSPTLLLKTRVMTNPIFRESMSLLETTLQSVKIGSDIVAHEGLVALMKGSNVFALKRVLDWSSRYYFADMFERLFRAMKKDKKLTVGEKSAASLLGGVASTCFTLPLDVLVAKIQDAKKAGVRVSPFVMFHDELRDWGWSGLQRNYMRGFEARLVHVSLTTLVIKTWTPIVYNILFPAS